MCLEELLEILTSDSYVHVVVYLNSYADSIALTYTKTAGENDVVLDLVLGNSCLKHFNYLLRSLKVAGGSNTYLNYKHITVPLQEQRS